MKRSPFLLFVVLFATGFFSACTQVDNGQVGIKNDFGHISDTPLLAGWHNFNPFVTTIDVWNSKTLEIKETARVPSSEGLITTLEVSLIYRVPEHKAPLIRKTIGEKYEDQIVQPYFREAIRNIASGYEVKALFSDKGRAEISTKMLTLLKSKLESRGFEVQDVLLRDVVLPSTFAASIETKLKLEQEALQKEFEKQKAQADAEIAEIQATGVAEANRIIAHSITTEFLKYEFIKQMKDMETKTIYIPTEAGMPILEARNK